jgi:hypothetical protein
MKDSTMYYNTWNKDSTEYGDSYSAVELKLYTTSHNWHTALNPHPARSSINFY